MGRMGSTTSVRAQEMRRVLEDWQRSGLTLSECGAQGGIPVSTLTWWRRVFRDAGREELKRTAAENAVEFSEVRPPANVRTTPAVLEIVAPSGHLVRVPAGADSATLRQVLEALRTTC
jgi:hypothetical protein